MILVQRQSLPKCDGTLFIAYNRVLAQVKETSKKLTLLLYLEIFSFFRFGYIYMGPYNN
jgi:hypothetical protein